MDLRIIKTHVAIRTAFIDLLTEQDYDDITIQAIIDKALVNRATFYKYYHGKSDLAEQMIDDFKQEINQVFLDRLNAEPKFLQVIMENHTQKMFEHRKQMLALWKIRTRRHNLYLDMFNMGKQNFIELAKKHPTMSHVSDATLDYQATMMSTIFLASFKYYFEKDLPLPTGLVEDWQQMIEVTKI
ncbi:MULTISPECIES: TetR/AcrR family transcriptional regulator [unclassified Moraxella]|uniref:TetR/AcrR family transcriptional regulator n=1 Tax=unclassified Moraxella TaxID=2685852 RepID=UPI003AF6D574